MEDGAGWGRSHQSDNGSALATLEKGQHRQGRTIYLSTDGKGSIPIEALQSVVAQGGTVVAAFDADVDGRKLTEKLTATIPNTPSLTPTQGKDWNEQLVSTRQELRHWYRQAQDIGRSETHIHRIQQVGTAFTQAGTPLTEQDLRVMAQDQTSWQQQVQTVTDCAQTILNQAGEPQAGGTLFEGKKYVLFARDNLLYALADQRGSQPTAVDQQILPDSIQKPDRGILLKATQGEVDPTTTSLTNADVQRFERFAALVSQRLLEAHYER